jgi:hypothetical protein
MRRRGRLRGCAIPVYFLILCWLCKRVGGEWDPGQDNTELLTRLRNLPVGGESAHAHEKIEAVQRNSENTLSGETISNNDSKGSKPSHDRPIHVGRRTGIDEPQAWTEMHMQVFSHDDDHGNDARSNVLPTKMMDSGGELSTGTERVTDSAQKMQHTRTSQYGCLLSRLSETLQYMVDDANKRRQGSDSECFEKLAKCRSEQSELSQSLHRIRKDAEIQNHNIRTWQRIANSLRQRNDTAGNSDGNMSTTSAQSHQHERAQAMIRKMSASLRDKRTEEQSLERNLKAAKVRCGLLIWKQRAAKRWSARWHAVATRAVAQLNDIVADINHGPTHAEVEVALEDMQDEVFEKCEKAGDTVDMREIRTYAYSTWLAFVRDIMHREGASQEQSRTHTNISLLYKLNTIRTSLHNRSAYLYESTQQERVLCSSLTSTADAVQGRVIHGEVRVEADARQIQAQERVVSRLSAHMQSLNAAVIDAQDALQRMYDNMVLLATQTQRDAYAQAIPHMQQRVADTRHERDQHKRTLAHAQDLLDRMQADLRRQQDTGQLIRARADDIEARAGVCKYDAVILKQSAHALGRHLAALDYVMNTVYGMVDGTEGGGDGDGDSGEALGSFDVPDWDSEAQRRWRTSRGVL